MRCRNCGSDYSSHARADGCWQCVKAGSVEPSVLEPAKSYDVPCNTEALLMLKAVYEETGDDPLVTLLERAGY